MMKALMPSARILGRPLGPVVGLSRMPPTRPIHTASAVNASFKESVNARKMKRQQAQARAHAARYQGASGANMAGSVQRDSRSSEVLPGQGLGRIADPYKAPLFAPPFELTPQGARTYARYYYELFKQKVRFYQNLYRQLPKIGEENFDAVRFAQGAQEAYVTFQEAVAKKDDTTARSFGTLMLLNALKEQNRKRIINWAYRGENQTPKLVHLVYLPHMQYEFMQATVKFDYKLTMSQQDAMTKKLIQGDPNKVKNITEYVVFERRYDVDDSWRVAGRVTEETAMPDAWETGIAAR
eukprot:Clim_evm4s251 gene=Clim_evmTU4s251